jgi:hypothetical protein
MKYYKMTFEDQLLGYQPDPQEYGGELSIPHDPNNRQYAEMMEGVEADPPTNIIEDKPLDHVKTYADKRRDAYGSWGEQLDMMYHGTWEDHVASVKAANPKE